MILWIFGINCKILVKLRIEAGSHINASSQLQAVGSHIGYGREFSANGILLALCVVAVLMLLIMALWMSVLPYHYCHIVQVFLVVVRCQLRRRPEVHYRQCLEDEFLAL